MEPNCDSKADDLAIGSQEKISRAQTHDGDDFYHLIDLELKHGIRHAFSEHFARTTGSSEEVLFDKLLSGLEKWAHLKSWVFEELIFHHMNPESQSFKKTVLNQPVQANH